MPCCAWTAPGIATKTAASAAAPDMRIPSETLPPRPVDALFRIAKPMVLRSISMDRKSSHSVPILPVAVQAGRMTARPGFGSPRYDPRRLSDQSLIQTGGAGGAPP